MIGWIIDINGILNIGRIEIQEIIRQLFKYIKKRYETLIESEYINWNIFEAVK